MDVARGPSDRQGLPKHCLGKDCGKCFHTYANRPHYVFGKEDYTLCFTVANKTHQFNSRTCTIHKNAVISHGGLVIKTLIVARWKWFLQEPGCSWISALHQSFKLVQTKIQTFTVTLRNNYWCVETNNSGLHHHSK